MVCFMKRQWPEVQHQLLQANAKRSGQMLAQSEPVCHASALSTPAREKMAYFTNTQRSPPLQLIARRDKLAPLPRNAAGEVDLARLLADSRRRGALVDGRSDGLFIDPLLVGQPARQTVDLYAASDYGSKILPMFSVGRGDDTIEPDMALSVGRDTGPRQAAGNTRRRGPAARVIQTLVDAESSPARRHAHRYVHRNRARPSVIR